MQQIFAGRLERPVPLNVVRETGTSALYFAFPTTLRQGDTNAIVRMCQECSGRYGAQLQAMVTDEISSLGSGNLHFAVRILTWRRREKDVLAEVTEVLRQVLHVQIVLTYRQ